ncbi:MAG: DsbE family thiol:disulfide interchange protein [Alphaproteobacteria bacterium]|nr:DsbE family thiol:disulfide interchange protein [Alphaproteobacteria bacterium]
MRRLLYFLPLVLFAGIAVYFYLGLHRDPRAVPSALIDKPVPDFALAPLAGRANGRETAGLATADLRRGEVTLVNVFASWCAPCRIEHPQIKHLAEVLKVRVDAINYKDKPEAALDWLVRLGDPYGRIGADPDGRAAIEWGVYGVPETYVVDRQGVIRYRHVGPVMPHDVEQVILPLLRRLGR